ncbi:hypothetical protein OBBRIDRAFT_835590 [Obba rivulosa]|uniref:Uncharacterized protein n=1 Tax=Obba rivulosa TaxID=1052685 RepID=A0A8E2B038_9APHY|nr:hypothetical protein OBBRIDRAFT_835590 [Obba rivulosa]
MSAQVLGTAARLDCTNRGSTTLLPDLHPSAVMMFSKATDKDQLRSFKSKVQLKIHSSLRPSSFVSSPCSSPMQSECSTLVNFIMEDVVEEEFDDTTALDDDNSAWMHDASRPARSQRQTKPRRLFRSTRTCSTKTANPLGREPEMLDPEDRAWV